MSDPQRVLLVGATGLVGSAVMQQAVALRRTGLFTLSRRQPEVPRGAQMDNFVADPAIWPRAVAEIAPEAVICALGTTWRKAGRSEEAFRAVDHDLVLAVAQASRNVGARRFVHVSSVGADAKERSFYLRVKGEVEVALTGLGFWRLDILRPGLLRGPRGADRRLLERLGVLFSPLADPLLRGRLRRYRSIEASTVAAAALQAICEEGPGRFVHENVAITRLASQLERRA